ncbi:cytidine deaminase [Clostridium botulinum]|nr:cytidine deaminase [Clostridium botulinum]
MNVAILTSLRSKDKNTKVGACIVDRNKKIISTGYNGFISGCKNDDFPSDREGDWLNTKYPYTVHSEANAIYNSHGKDLRNCVIYVTLFPCNECTKAIIQSGITHIIYLSDKYKGTNSNIASKKMLDIVGIKYERYKENRLIKEI